MHDLRHGQKSLFVIFCFLLSVIENETRHLLQLVSKSTRPPFNRRSLKKGQATPPHSTPTFATLVACAACQRRIFMLCSVPSHQILALCACFRGKGSCGLGTSPGRLTVVLTWGGGKKTRNREKKALFRRLTVVPIWNIAPGQAQR